MAIHDWTTVESGIFHHFHHAWIEELQRALNRGLLPPNYYALSEQIAGGVVPDVLTLQGPPDEGPAAPRSPVGIAVADAPPKARFHASADADAYAQRAKSVVIRHRSGHDVVAMIEIVSPGNKNSRHGLNSFIRKSVEMLRAGVHLLVIDLFPPGPRDPHGIHRVIWDEVEDNSFELPPDKPLTLASYVAGNLPEAYIEPVGRSDSLPEMPIFLTPAEYVLVPLATTYELAWQAVPAYWRKVIGEA